MKDHSIIIPAQQGRNISSFVGRFLENLPAAVREPA